MNESVWPSLTAPERALWHSSCGPLSSSPFTALPTFAVTRFDPPTIPGAPLLAPAPCHASHFPLLPMRPSTRHFWPSSSIMCGGWGPWQKRVGFGTGCRTSLPRRRWSTNVMLRDLDVAQPPVDGRRLEIVVDGLPTSPAPNSQSTPPRHRDGRATRGAASTPGVALRRARRRKEQTHPELHGNGGRACLVVLAAEVGGRWSNEAAQFLGELAAFKASTAEILRERVRGAWLRRWRNILSCSAAKAFVLSLLDKRPVTCAGSRPPSAHEVVRECRHALCDRSRFSGQF